MLNFFAFLFALTLLVSVHAWGHYRVAVALGVKVLRFSVGLGSPLWRFRQFSHGDELTTEWTVGRLPLGGFVELMDESQGNVCPNPVHQALDRQPLGARALIVVAGPLANLFLAVVLLSFAAGWGQPEPMAVLSTPIAQSPADKAGLRGGELVVSSAVGTADAFAALHFQSDSSYTDLITQSGLSAYLGFLGFLSISLAVLNLLPLPLLDGGHLMYYLWELMIGNPVSSDWANVLQKVGLMLLASLMVIAVVND